jgi:hypothetical protein
MNQSRLDDSSDYELLFYETSYILTLIVNWSLPIPANPTVTLQNKPPRTNNNRLCYQLVNNTQSHESHHPEKWQKPPLRNPFRATFSSYEVDFSSNLVPGFRTISALYREKAQWTHNLFSNEQGLTPCSLSSRLAVKNKFQ